MSVRYEWLLARLTRIEWIPNNHDVRTGELPDEESNDEDITTYGGALLLAGDEVTVIAGTPDEVRDLLTRALRALP